ncbi:MAG TPA: toprim domain-containing protein [Chitinophagaceae bacterium]|nr:toprim domain-containing protein [Chitinophagaceae bacterium]
MNIEQAKSIALSAILDKLGFKPAKHRVKETIYLSPLRDENTASFHVHHAKNVWFDHGTSEGGDIVDFVCAWLKSKGEAHTIRDALRWLANMGDLAPFIAPVNGIDNTPEDNKLILKKVSAIQEKGLIHYLESRGIPLVIGRAYLKELRVYNQESCKTFFALGFKNEDDGYELRNKLFKGCIRPKAITFIRGEKEKPQAIHVFEGFMDFLSLIAENQGKRLRDDAIILNSLSCLKQATPYIKNYGYEKVYTWMDNDKAGQKATAALDAFLETEPGLMHKPMNRCYALHKDLNAAYMHKLGLTA